MTTACTQGAHHIGLAVRDVAEARDFFVEALGFRVAAERPDYPAISARTAARAACAFIVSL